MCLMRLQHEINSIGDSEKINDQEAHNLCVGKKLSGQRRDMMEKEALLEIPGQAKPYAPYSYGCKVKKVDTFIFISGVVPNDSHGDIVCKGDILGQTRKTVENLRATVEAAGGSFNDVIKLTTYVVADAMKDYLSTSACFEYLSSFPKPAESLVGVACLANEGQLIEIEGIFGI